MYFAKTAAVAGSLTSSQRTTERGTRGGYKSQRLDCLEVRVVMRHRGGYSSQRLDCWRCVLSCFSLTPRRDVLLSVVMQAQMLQRRARLLRRFLRASRGVRRTNADHASGPLLPGEDRLPGTYARIVAVESVTFAADSAEAMAGRKASVRLYCAALAGGRHALQQPRSSCAHKL